ncbi:uncharacterized protein LOC142557437 [Dermacentor variabilis]|uniref:uncharacterized protein LOC142557437 n=1 Tax=Dermacentor variabilis TaxID=34621 RepID=UPI003F5B15CF
MQPLASWQSLFALLSLSLFDYGNCQLYRRLRLVPPMNATAVCPNVAWAGVEGYARTVWFFPNGSRVVSGGRTAVDEARGVLDVVDPRNEDLGVYMCVSLRGSDTAEANATLAFMEIYSAQRRTLAERLWIGGLASLCVLVAVAFVGLVMKFRYRQPQTDKRAGAPADVREGVVNKRFETDEMSTVF